MVLEVQAGENGIRLATAEDLIVLKLIANRDKDQADLQGYGCMESTGST